MEEEIIEEAPVIKPAETYLVEEEITEEVPVIKPAETYLVAEEIPIEVDDLTTVNSNSIHEVLPAIEPVSNSLEPVFEPVKDDDTVILAKPNSGYWVEVSGDRDSHVEYHA